MRPGMLTIYSKLFPYGKDFSWNLGGLASFQNHILDLAWGS